MSREGSGIYATIKGLIELSRPVNTLMGVLSIFVGIAVASREIPIDFMPLNQILLHIVSGCMIAASIMIINDVVDYEIDKINAPWRPIPSGRVSRDLAWIAGLSSAMLGLALSSLIQPVPQVMALAIIVLLLAHSYNFYFKKTPLIGNIIVAGITALPILYGGLVTQYYLGVDAVNWIRLSLIWLMTFSAVMGREIIKGIADIEGDKQKGVKTIAVLLGVRKASYIAGLLYAISILASLAIGILGLVNPKIYLPSIILINAIAVLETYKLLRNPEPSLALAHKKRVLYLMLVALIIIYVSSV